MNNAKDFPIVLIAPFGIDFGIRHISSFLKAKGYPAHIVLFNLIRYAVELDDNDYFNAPLLNNQTYPIENSRLLIKLLKQLKPRLIGISVSSVVMRTAREMTIDIRNNLNSTIVWGGIHAIIAPEECIQYADIVCTGEGEFPMWELAKTMESGGKLTGIKNLWIKNNNIIEKNDLGPLIEDLDILPFPDFIEEGNKFLIDSGKIVENPPILSFSKINLYPIMTSRGCMFSCAYCCNSVIGEKYKGRGAYLRRRSVDNVIGELKLAVENKRITAIRFWDDVFTYDKDWIEEFCRRFVSEIGKPFICYAHPKYTDQEILSKLVESGLIYVVIGLQSGSENVTRNIFNRVQSFQDIINFGKTIKELGIILEYDLISDNPYETEADQDETVELLLKLPRPYYAQIYSLCYFPETPLTKKALNEKLINRRELEQYSSKALNNFSMFLLLSKSKGQFFWNCLKAMAVNKHFPKSIVRLCKRSTLFKNNPGLLFFLSRNYLRIFRLVKIKRLRLGNVTHGKNNFLFFKEKLTFKFFILGNAGNHKRFCLKIGNKLQRDLLLQFLFEICLFRENKFNVKAQWEKAKFKIKGNSEGNLYLDFEYPELRLSLNGRAESLKLSKNGNFEYQGKKLYLIKIKYRGRGRLIKRFRFREAGRIFLQPSAENDILCKGELNYVPGKEEGNKCAAILK